MCLALAESDLSKKLNDSGLESGWRGRIVLASEPDFFSQLANIELQESTKKL
jgi:hypothetical protein